jgi:membrane protein DedA with SNARE-associated domain
MRPTTPCDHRRAMLIEIPEHVGYAAIAAFVAVEASGVPVPGETALISGAVLASQGELAIELVIPFAAVAAIAGDNVGYLLGARFGRRLLARPGRTQAKRLEALHRGSDLFERHGAKAVFFGRWIALLRIWAAWLAGMTAMRWRSFLLWNALGGIGWALCFGVLGYFGGKAAAELVARLGIAVAVAVGAVALVALLVLRGRSARRL